MKSGWNQKGKVKEVLFILPSQLSDKEINFHTI